MSSAAAIVVALLGLMAAAAIAEAKQQQQQQQRRLSYGGSVASLLFHRPYTPSRCPLGQSHIADERSCHSFFHCSATAWGGVTMTKKTCGTLLMFHPESQVCDWPLRVGAVRPECRGRDMPAIHWRAKHQQHHRRRQQQQQQQRRQQQLQRQRPQKRRQDELLPALIRDLSAHVSSLATLKRIFGATIRRPTETSRTSTLKEKNKKKKTGTRLKYQSSPLPDKSLLKKVAERLALFSSNFLPISTADKNKDEEDEETSTIAPLWKPTWQTPTTTTTSTTTTTTTTSTVTTTFSTTTTTTTTTATTSATTTTTSTTTTTITTTTSTTAATATTTTSTTTTTTTTTTTMTTTTTPASTSTTTTTTTTTSQLASDNVIEDDYGEDAKDVKSIRSRVNGKFSLGSLRIFSPFKFTQLFGGAKRPTPPVYHAGSNLVKITVLRK